MEKKKKIAFTIIPTYKCNLHSICTYCYAKEMSSKFGEIEIEDFRNIILWLKEEYKKVEIVLIGGEATMHSQFDQMLQIMNSELKSAKLYTNNLYSKDKLELILACEVLKKFNIHYEPDYIKTDSCRKKFFYNLDALHKNDRQLNLRYNITDPNFDYTEIISLAEKYESLILYSITAPGGQNNDYVPLEHIKKFSNKLEQFARAANDKGLKIKSARPLPFCAFTEQQLDFLKEEGGLKGFCTPYKAINPDMTVLGCSSLIDLNMIKISNKDEFIKSLEDFEYFIDEVKWKYVSINNCEDCNEFKERHCQGGCLTYKGPLFNNPLEGGSISSCNMAFYDRH